MTIVEPVSKYTLIGNRPQKPAKLVVNLTIGLLAPDQKKVHPITADNGQELTKHQHIAPAPRTDLFFAHPYHSWERGLNENINGLMRQYFPKGDSLEKVSNKKLQSVMDRWNHRPRKTLGFKTPDSIIHGIVP